MSLEVHTALVSPWEWAEYLNIINHVGISGVVESCRGSSSYGEVRSAPVQDKTVNRCPGLGLLADPSFSAASGVCLEGAVLVNRPGLDLSLASRFSCCRSSLIPPALNLHPTPDTDACLGSSLQQSPLTWMEAADEGHFRQRQAAEGRGTEEAPLIETASVVGQAPEAADLGLSRRGRRRMGCVLLSEQGGRGQSQGLGLVAVKRQDGACNV